MDVLCVFIVVTNFCLLSHVQADTNGTNETEPLKVLKKNNETTKLELFPPRPVPPGQTRMPRKFFPKLHSGAAFLAGLKVGAVLSKKGFELGHGKIASTHSFQIFGKSVNSAMSLAYGNVPSALPLVNDVADTEGNGGLKKNVLEKDGKNVYHVTVIEDSAPEIQAVEAEEEEGQKQQETEEDKKKKKKEVLVLYQDLKENSKVEEDFLKNHNERVKEFNESILKRTNSKF